MPRKEEGIGIVDQNELIPEFRKVGATAGDQDGQPGSFIQDGRLVLRVNGQMLFMDEAHEYLRSLQADRNQA